MSKTYTEEELKQKDKVITAMAFEIARRDMQMDASLGFLSNGVDFDRIRISKTAEIISHFTALAEESWT